jgi:hypothetical protein
LKWEPLSLNNEQMQYLENRKFSVSEVARWFGIPPHLLGDLEKATFSNIEQQSQEFLNICLRPWLVRIEAAFLTAFYELEELEDHAFEFLADAILRADTQTRFTAYKVGIESGILSPNECREMENRNPIPGDEGDKFIRPLNMQVMGEETVTDNTQTTKDPAQQDQPDPEVEADQKRTALISMLDEACAKVVRRFNRVRSLSKFDRAQYELDCERDLSTTLSGVFVVNYGLDKKAEAVTRLVQYIMQEVEADKGLEIGARVYEQMRELSV